jgi:iron(III) transport system ATP-binding protein
VVCSALGDITAQPNEGISKDSHVVISIRPEDVELSESEPERGNDDNVCRGTVTGRDFLGDYMDFHVTVSDVVVLAKAHPSLRTPTGDPVYLKIKAEKCIAISVEKRIANRE